jgi:hypothetical protein
LAPFLDKDNILRVGGRLKDANILYNKEHPILLPKRHHVTDLIIKERYVRLYHAGIHAGIHASRN